MIKIWLTPTLLVLLFVGFYFLTSKKPETLPGQPSGGEADQFVGSSEEEKVSSSSVSENGAAEKDQSAASAAADFSRLNFVVLKEGGGAGAKEGDQLTLHYQGFLADGTKFDSSLDRGQPFVFKLGEGQVIAGWDQGLLGMKVGEVRRLFIPSALAYGEPGTPGGPIPPNANLVFEAQLLKID